VAFLVLLPLPEQRLPLERLAELRERRAAGSQSSQRAEAPGLPGTASNT
jgi:hypothetical protein